MKPEKILLFIVIAAAIGVVLFSKFKTCQNSASGELNSRPWFWPCGSSAVNVDVTSNQNNAQEIYGDS